MSTKKITALSVSILALALASGLYFWQLRPNSSTPERPHWPATVQKDEWTAAARVAASDPRARDFIAGDIDYRPDGAYFDYAKLSYTTRGKVRLDEDGLPTVQYGEDFFYNPVTLAQFALSSHAKHLAGATPVPFVKAAEKLIEIQDEDGAFRYPFHYRHYTQNTALKAGWTSAMAQGLALSTFARAYEVTGNQAFAEAADQALAFLNVEFPAGPRSSLADLDSSLKGYVFFLEYPTDPNVYTLNGFMFTLLGLIDWAKIGESAQARDLFDRGIEALKNILPYYDLGALTSYDLSHLILPDQAPHIVARYHSVHIEQLKALYAITEVVLFREYAERWIGYGVAEAPAAEVSPRQ